MSFKTIVLVVIILIQIVIYYKYRKTNKFLPFFALNIYTIKPIIENYLSFVDPLIQLVIIISILFEIIRYIKNGKSVRYNRYLIFFFVLIVINGLYNTFTGHTISRFYIQGLMNYSFILILIFYFMNTIKNEIEFKNILLMTKYNGILIFLYSIYDKLVLGLERTGGAVNPNYISQMSLILLLFYVYSVENKVSLKSLVYYCMLLFSIISSGSSSGIMAIGIIILSLLLFKMRSRRLIILSNYIVWITMFYFMFVIIFTSNYEFGILKYFVKSEDTSRIVLWQYTYENIKAHPIMGTFYNSFRAPWGNLEMVTHNDYLRLMVELGVGSIVLLFSMVNKQIKNILKFKNMDGFFLYSFIMITLSFSLSHNNINNLMFWFALTLPSILMYGERKSVYTGGENNENS